MFMENSLLPEKRKHGIIHAYTIGRNGENQLLSDDDSVAELVRSETLAWVHLDATDPACRAWLEREVNYLDEIIIDALLADETRPRVLEFKGGSLLILRGVNLNSDAVPEDMVSIRLWVDNHRIISMQRRPLKAVADLLERVSTGDGIRSSGDFIAQLIGNLFERMEPIFSELDETLDGLEEKVMENPNKEDRGEIISIRKQAIMFRRYIAPQRDVVNHLRVSEQPWMEQIHKRRLQESQDQVLRYIEDLEAVRERAQVVKDELTNVLSDRMNKNMYMLSVVAAIFLPLGFLTGLLGVNVGGIPGSENSNAFLAFNVILLGIIACQILIFKKLKWF